VSDRERGREDRRRLWLAGAVGLIALVAAIGFAISRNSDSTASTEPPGSTATTMAGASSTTGVPGSDGTVPETASTIPTVEFPDDPIPQDGAPSETCTAIQAQLQEYRDIAAETEPESLIQLSLGLEEFEHEIDFLGKGADWSNAILEQVFQVRRDWVTASSAARSGDQVEAEARHDSALGYLDAALAVECPAA